jgi:hypothetical protein
LKAIYTIKDQSSVINQETTLEREYLFQYRHYDKVFASIAEFKDAYYMDEMPIVLDARNSLNPNYPASWVT